MQNGNTAYTYYFCLQIVHRKFHILHKTSAGIADSFSQSLFEMNSSKSLVNLIRQIKIGTHHKTKLQRNTAYPLYLLRNYSNQSSQAEELVVKEKIQINKPTVTKWKRPPFVQNFFLGKFDTELLAFPEVLDPELLIEVEKYVKELNELYAQKVNSRQIDEIGEIPNDLLQDLRELGLFGRMMPTKYGGLDLTYTACTRLNEVIGLDWSLYSLLTAHEFLASRVILLFGTEEQKNKYLPLLATGKKIAAFCSSEPESGSELISISSTAVNTDDDSYLIHGSKCWVTNADIADVFIVFAKLPNLVDPEKNDISVFIVDRNSEGVVITPQEKVCLRGVKTSMVNFKEVRIPKENLIGQPGQGCEIFFKTMEGFRIAMNSFTFGTLKVLLDSVTDHIINTERIERSLGDVQLVRQKLSRIACKIYAMESLAYFTSGILDTTENPQVYFESSILKIFNSEGTLYCIRELMELLGSSSLMKEQHLERLHRDALGLYMFDGSNDVIRLFIGLSGCKNTGAAKVEDVVKERNRFFFPGHILKKNIKRMRLFSSHVNYNQDLAGHMHPSLVQWGNQLEEKLQKFEIAVEDILTEHGTKVVDTQIEPRQLGDAAVYLYAQSAVLSRASRSYCIGLKNASQEMELAGAFCHDANEILYNILSKIFESVYKNNEGAHLELGGEVIDCRGYFPEHPLKYNF